MKSIFFVCCLLLSVSVLPAQYRMKTVQVFGDASLESQVAAAGATAPGQTYGLGANINTGNQWLNLVLEYNLQTVALSGLPSAPRYLRSHELYAGIRFFPMKPTWIAGNMAIRPTFGGNYGFDFEPTYKGYWYAGVALSPIRDVSGVVISAIYRPGTHVVKGYTLSPSWGIRLALAMGPSADE